MTITVNISQEAEDILRERATDSGQPVVLVAERLIESTLLAQVAKPAPEGGRREGESRSAYLKRIGVLGAVESTPRADGIPWSEIEAACDPH